MKANKFYISGLDHSRDIPDIKRAINSHEGVNAVRIDVEANTVTVDYDDGRYDEGDIKNFVTQTGLQVTQIKEEL